jgi:hypothetical protein
MTAQPPNSGHIVAGTEPVSVNLRREGIIVEDVRGADIHVDGARQGPAITVGQPDTARPRLDVGLIGLTANELIAVQKRMAKRRVAREDHEKTCERCKNAKRFEDFCDEVRPAIVAQNADWKLIEPQVRRG